MPDAQGDADRLPLLPRDAMLEAYRGYLLTIALKELSSDAQAGFGASDLVQETFLAAHKHLDQFRGSTPAELRGWLRQILRNKLVDLNDRRVRAAASISVLPGEGSTCIHWTDALSAGGPTPSEVAGRREEVATVLEILDQIEQKYRSVIRWRLEEDLSFQEIGSRLGVSENAAEKCFARAVHKVRRLLESRP
jgi:RNA polymerase sigma-70 factor, ECF subfamily